MPETPIDRRSAAGRADTCWAFLHLHVVADPLRADAGASLAVWSLRQRERTNVGRTWDVALRECLLERLEGEFDESHRRRFTRIEPEAPLPAWTITDIHSSSEGLHLAIGLLRVQQEQDSANPFAEAHQTRRGASLMTSLQTIAQNCLEEIGLELIEVYHSSAA